VGRARCTKNLTKLRQKKARTFADIKEKHITAVSETKANRIGKRAK
jgi:hypothetical protein